MKTADRVALVFSTLVAAAVAGTSAADADDCPAKLLAKLDVTGIEEARPTVDVELNGKAAKMLIGLASPFSVVLESRADQLGLPRSAGGERTEVNEGPYTVRGKFARAETLRLGAVTIEQADLVVGSDAGTASVVRDGVIGAEILTRYDLELDFGHGKLNLFERARCKEQAVYWPNSGIGTARLGFDLFHRSVTGGSLDGRDVSVIIDPLVGRSQMSLAAARSIFDWRTDPPGLQPLTGPGGVQSHYIFDTLTLGGTQFTKPDILIVEDGQTPRRAPKILQFGLDFLTHLRLYLARKEGQVYFTRSDPAVAPNPPK